MYLLFDACMIAILVFSVWRGYKRGIIRSLIKIGLVAASVFAANQLTRLITPVLADALPMPGVGTKLSSYLATNILDNADADIGTLMADWGFCGRAATGIENFVLSRSDDFSRSIAKTLSEYIDTLFTEAIIFIFLLITFLLISLFLYMMISNALERSPLSLLDHVVGIASGAAMALVSILIICFLVSWTLPLVDASFDVNLGGMIAEKSLLIRITEKINPFYLLLG